MYVNDIIGESDPEIYGKEKRQCIYDDFGLEYKGSNTFKNSVEHYRIISDAIKERHRQCVACVRERHPIDRSGSPIHRQSI